MRYPLSNEDRIGSSLIRITVLESSGSSGPDEAARSAGEGSPGQTVEMFIPNGLQLNDGVNYAGTNLGLLGQTALEAASGGSIAAGIDAVAGAGRSISGALEDPEVRALIGTITGASVAGGALARILDRVGGSTAPGAATGLGALLGAGAIAGAAQLGAGRVLNPNTKALFQSINIRTFTFQFNMIPVSPEEADVIADIVDFFRTQLYPGTESSSGYQLFLKYPNKFRISIVPGNNEDSRHVVNFKPCFLTNVSRSYNPTATTYHEDGAPVETVLGLTFTEEAVLTSEDVAGGL